MRFPFDHRLPPAVGLSQDKRRCARHRLHLRSSRRLEVAWRQEPLAGNRRHALHHPHGAAAHGVRFLAAPTVRQRLASRSVAHAAWREARVLLARHSHRGYGGGVPAHVPHGPRRIRGARSQHARRRSYAGMV